MRAPTLSVPETIVFYLAKCSVTLGQPVNGSEISTEGAHSSTARLRTAPPRACHAMSAVEDKENVAAAVAEEQPAEGAHEAAAEPQGLPPKAGLLSAGKDQHWAWAIKTSGWDMGLVGHGIQVVDESMLACSQFQLLLLPGPSPCSLQLHVSCIHGSLQCSCCSQVKG